ncbi:hypothetical protein MA16_Dca024034 [Dendrobium catenatum]|uniref:Uncharacterized protein n=1 Tax=Dendrobium catenatum TaxID=906689 RepID=A0A2I0X7X4_9ASPA|nr:hypothetical protein MA16_Dca024034 [Dendrobium catenatum]
MERGMDLRGMSKGVLIGKEGKAILAGEVLILTEEGGTWKKGLGMNAEGRIGTIGEGHPHGEGEIMEDSYEMWEIRRFGN